MSRVRLSTALVENADPDDDAEESGYGGSSDNEACEVRENAGFNDSWGEWRKSG